MKIKINGRTVEPVEYDETITKVEVFWLGSPERLWVTQSTNKRGDQIGEADYAAHKASAIKAARQIAEGTTIEVVIGTRRG